jgi:farnesyl-diphosphate farnesyltransferase
MNSEELQAHLENVSRTFALSISYLVQPHKRHSTIAYLLCRIPDTIEDSKLTVQQKNDLLHTYYVTLKNRLDGSLFVSKVTSCSYIDSDDWDLVEQTEEILAEFYTLDTEIQSIIRTWVLEMTTGMKRYVSRDTSHRGVNIKTQDDLQTYCYYVAGTIGNMIGELLEATYDSYEFTDSLRTHATQYGLFLQEINVSKDVYEDYTEEHTVYLPRTILESNGLTLDQDFLEQKIPIMSTVTTILETTRSYATSAEKFLESVQDHTPDNYQGWAIPYELAVETRSEIHNSLADVPTKTPVKIDRAVVNDVVQRTAKPSPSVRE